MSYLTSDEFIDRYTEREARQLTDRDNAGVVDAALLQRALDEASAFVDGYLARRYALPLTVAATGVAADTPEVIKRIVGDVTRYQLTGTYVLCTEDIRTRYKDATGLLDRIAKGDVGLGVELQLFDSPSAPVAGASAVRTGCKLFGGSGTPGSGSLGSMY